MSDNFTESDRVEVRGFGPFMVNVSSLRVGRIPKTGEQVKVPEKAIPHFKAGQELRKRVRLSELGQG
jgi:integration host factor subunit beta